MPKIGDIENGYKFIGGDPADQGAWEPAESQPTESILLETQMPGIGEGSLDIGGVSLDTGESSIERLPSEEPAIGTVIDGYEYLGGGAGDRDRWKATEDLVGQPQEPMDVSFADRVIVKNFSKDKKTAVDYLNTKNPGLNAQVEEATGQIYHIDKNGQPKFLDPDISAFDALFGLPNVKVVDGKLESVGDRSIGAVGKASMEVMKDAADIAVDLGITVVENAAGVAAAAGTFGASGNPALALGAGSLAMGATGGSLEALRLSVGKAIGLRQDINMSDIAIPAGVSTLSGILFGTGMSLNAAHKSMQKQGASETIKNIEKKAMKEVFGESGVLGTIRETAKRATKRVSAISTGINSDLYEMFTKNKQYMKKLDDHGVKEISEEIGSEAYSLLLTKRRKVGDLIAETMGSAEKINISDAKKIYKTEIDTLRKGAKTPADYEVLEAVEKEYGKLFTMSEQAAPELPERMTSEQYRTFMEASTSGPSELPDVITGSNALSLKGQIAESGKIWKDTPTTDRAKNLLNRLAKASKKAIDESVEKSVAGMPKINSEYRRLKNLEGVFENLYKVNSNGAKMFADKTYETLTGLPGKRVLAESLDSFDKEFGTALIIKSKLLQAHKSLGKSKIFPMDSRAQVASSAVKLLGLPTAGFIIGSTGGDGYKGGLAGSSIATAAGLVGLSPAAWKLYYAGGRGITPWMRNVAQSMRKTIIGKPDFAMRLMNRLNSGISSEPNLPLNAGGGEDVSAFDQAWGEVQE